MINQPFLDEMAPYERVLEGCLALGKNGGKILLAISREGHRANAEAFVRAHGQPTAATPEPDIDIRVVTDNSVQHGAMINDRLVVRYT